NRVQRCAKLVRKRCEELILDTVCFSKLVSAFFDDPLEFARISFERTPLVLDLTAHLSNLNRAGQRRDKVFPVDGLLNKARGAGSERLKRQVVLAVTGYEKRRHVRPQRLHFGQQSEAVHSWHFYVADYRVVVDLGYSRDRHSSRIASVDRHRAKPEPQ